MKLKQIQRPENPFPQHDSVQEFILEFTKQDLNNKLSHNRTKKGRELYKRACDPCDETVSFWVKRQKGGKTPGELLARLRVQSGKEVWHTTIGESWYGCTCPDHQNRKYVCKHLRALAGCVVKPPPRRDDQPAPKLPQPKLPEVGGLKPTFLREKQSEPTFNVYKDSQGRKVFFSGNPELVGLLDFDDKPLGEGDELYEENDPLKDFF